MKININIEVSPSELIELQDVAHEGTRDVVTKLTGKDMAHKILEHLEVTPNQMAYHIPADHMETGTVIQGKPPREPDARDVIRPGDLVKVQWPDDWDMPDEWYATYGDTYRVEEIVPSPVAFVRPIGKETILPYIADIEWLSRVEPEPTPPRPMRSFDTRIQTGDIVIIQPFTGHNEIFVVLSANNEKALLHSENNEIKIVDLYKLLRVWPDPESVYGVYCGAIAVEPPKE